MGRPADRPVDGAEVVRPVPGLVDVYRCAGRLVARPVILAWRAVLGLAVLLAAIAPFAA